MCIRDSCRRVRASEGICSSLFCSPSLTSSCRLLPKILLCQDVYKRQGLGYVIGRICKNKQLLRSRQLLQQQMKTELDERNQYLHDKSGGIVADILLAILLFVTLTASMLSLIHI